MSVPVSTKTSRKPNLDLEDGIEYPSSDGKPMGETGTHARVAMVCIYGVLDRYFMNNPRVAVNANMFMYYVQGDPKRNVCPDAFVAMGVPNEPDRRSYKVWKEGKAPDVVFEVTSRKTRKQDLTKKFEIYRDVLQVREYFLFDPFEEYLDPSLQGYRLVAGSYEPTPMIKGGMPSEVLGLELQRDGENLRSFNPETGKLLPSMHELVREVDLAARVGSGPARRKWPGARRKWQGERRSKKSSVCSEKSKSCVGDCPRSKNEARQSRSLAWNCTGCGLGGRGTGRPCPLAPQDQTPRARRRAQLVPDSSRFPPRASRRGADGDQPRERLLRCRRAALRGRGVKGKNEMI